MNAVDLVAQIDVSSGLVRYLEEALARQQVTVRRIDCRSRKRYKAWPALKCFHFNRQEWLKRRWEQAYFSVEAWHRNTRRNGRLLGDPPDAERRILQVGGCYFPHPRYREIPYHLFITYPMILCYRDRTKPWIPPPEDREAFLALESDLYQQAAGIFVNAGYVKQSLVEDYRVAEDRITVTGLGVNPYFLDRPPENIPTSCRHNLLFVGYDFGYKGGADLLAAFAIARESIPELTLTVVGPGADQVPTTPGVQRTGLIRDRNALLACYREADLFVMPSLCDSFGFVFLEAMTQGVPCIGTDLNAMPEIIAHEHTGYVVPVRNPRVLADAILRFYAEPENRLRMGRASLERVRLHYTWEHVVKKMLAAWHV